MVRCGRAVTAAILAVSLLAFGCGSTGSTPHVDGAAGAAAGGSAGAAVGGSAGTPGEPVPPVDGRWAMFSAEDPVGIELTVSNGVVSGLGCYGGLPTTLQPDLAKSCTPLSGTAEGRHLQFTFLANRYPYSADVYASSDGQRMAGDFHSLGGWYSSFTWLRAPDDYPWLRESSEPSAVGLALEAHTSMYELEGLVDRFGKPGRLNVYGYFRTVVGTLGAFWETEMTWNEAEQTLVAGPVPETAPELATLLTLHFSGPGLLSVDAIFPSGEARSFALRSPTR